MYKNMTEILVEQKLESLWKSEDCCKCRRCHDDIMTYALNRLPTHYVSTTKGELYNKASTLSVRYDIEIVKILTMAIEVVKQHPRHPIQESVNGFQVFSEQDLDDE